MHIITGLLLSMLLSRKNDQSLPPLLQTRWPIITKHLLPGRVRFQIPLLVGRQDTLDQTIKQIRKIDGVDNAEASGITGTVLITFDEGKLKADLLYAALIRLLGLEKELERTPNSFAGKAINNLNQSLNQAIYAQTKGAIDSKTLIPLSVGAVGLYRLMAQQPISMPSALIFFVVPS